MKQLIFWLRLPSSLNDIRGVSERNLTDRRDGHWTIVSEEWSLTHTIPVGKEVTCGNADSRTELVLQCTCTLVLLVSSFLITKA